MIRIEYDPFKNKRNIKDRNLSFDLINNFEWDTALIWPDDRYEYGETRYCALGYIGLRIHHLVYTDRKDVVRVISLRKATQNEVKRYAEA